MRLPFPQQVLGVEGRYICLLYSNSPAGHDGDVRSWSQPILANFVPERDPFLEKRPCFGGGSITLGLKDSWEIKDLELLFHVAVRDSVGADVSYALNK